MPAPAIGLGLVLAVLTLSAPALSDEGAPLPRRKIALLPIKNFALDESPFSGKKKLGPEAALSSVLARRLAEDPDFDVLGPDQLRQRIKGLRVYQDVGIALKAKEDGEARYRDLDAEGSITPLEQAEAGLDAAYYDLVSPGEMATLELTLAQAYVEQKGFAKVEGRIHEALKRLFWLDPGRTFTKGFFPDSFESLINKAITDFRPNFPKDNPLRTQARLDRFLTDIDVDTLIYAWLQTTSGTDRGAELHVRIYDRTLATVSYSHPLQARTEAGVAALTENFDRFLTAWLTCLPKTELDTGPRAPSLRRFFIDAGFAYSIFTVNDATRNPFHHMGVALYAEYQFLAGLGAFVRVDLFSSTLDEPEHDLLSNVTSARVGLGITYAFQGSWWRLAPHFGLEVQFLGTLQTSSAAWCKFEGLGSDICKDRGGVETDLSGAITTGPTVGLSAQFFASRNFYIGLRANVSIYIAPFADVDQLNIPFSAETSLGYSY